MPPKTPTSTIDEVPHPCPDWQYEDLPKRKKLLGARVDAVLGRLRTKKLDGKRAARDSRAVHLELFKDLTPPHFPYFAGNYRGETFRCLDVYRIRIDRQTILGGLERDERVGAEPEDVAARMVELGEMIDKALDAADELRSSGKLSDEDQLLYVAEIACNVFDLFLRVHPYANGNGHLARFISWAILGRYGYWPARIWTVEPRPDPPYLKLLEQHRAGNTIPLVEYVMATIRKPAGPQ